ncbi:MAG: alpha-galactosidase, partial [Candidatus Aminicenantes bacterium]
IIFGAYCEKSNIPGMTQTAENAAVLIEFNSDFLKIEGDLEEFDVTWTSKELEKGLEIVDLQLRSQKASTPPRFSVKWDFPSIDITGFWNPNISVDKVSYYRNRVTSRASSYAPVSAFMNAKDMNRFTFASSDALNKVSLRSYLKEEDARFYCEVVFFEEQIPPLEEYSVQIRIDTRDIPYFKALDDVSNWWATMKNYTPAPVPDSAKWPMYSTWYSFHQNLDADDVVNECKIAKTLGFDAVIVDDGWQTLDSQRGYAFTGDWEPVRIPDMKGFVQRIHDLGMKFLLWYSLPFVGENSRNYQRFRGKYLTYWEGQGTYVLDPRYPEVREFIINTYETALKAWDLDGFKLDFIARFAANEQTVLTKSNGRDYASVNEAVDKLMTDVMSRLRALKPDILIEFRQPYIGPLMRKYGNMFRATDCPNMAAINRARTTDIRLLCGNTAIHSDMFMWHADDTVETAALQILNILFSVPQLSVRLDSIPEEHLKMVEFWIDYWRENRDVLLDGEFIPVNPGAVYPKILARTGTKTIVALYNEGYVSLDGKDCTNIDIVNAKGSHDVILDLTGDMGNVNTQIYNCRGNIAKTQTLSLKKGVYKFTVPASGLLTIEKK